MKRKTLVVNSSDNVATALTDLEAEEQVEVFIPGGAKEEVILRQAVPLGHKFALARIPSGAQVIKYGLPIGIATQAIERGEHVHVHNLE